MAGVWTAGSDLSGGGLRTMCTVSFIVRENGYALVMNRDEQLTRAAGLPPKLRKVDDRSVLCPSEPGGGTWIALNDTGATLALVNWYSVEGRVRMDAISRGEVVSSVGAADGRDFVNAALAELPLAKMNPFRLIGIFPAAQEIFEWRWNLKKLICKKRPWKPQQWISSGFDEPKAHRIRSAAFRQALALSPSGSIGRLRNLHRSHVPDCGPFSICMHRSDAATVSSTEITLSSRRVTMRYQPGAPCQTSENYVRHVRVLQS